jgi:flagellar hook-associated protein 2
VALSLDGIASGLDSATLIADLMKLEAIPQSLLKNRVTATETKITDFQSLNAKIASIYTLANANKTGTGLHTFSATSSSAGVTVTAAAGATGGSLDVTVGQLAQAQTSVSAPMTAWPSTPPVLTIVGADGKPVEITAKSTDLTDVAAAINAANSGVIATRVASGTDAEGVAQYRLQLTSAATGVAGAFDVYRGTAAEVAAATATDVLAEPGAAAIRSAQDATITLWAGTAAAQTITSSTNDFTNLLPGVTITATKVSTEPATIIVARDAAKATAVVTSLVESLSTTLGLIDSKSATIKTEDATGKEVTGLGSFTSDGTIRNIRSTLVRAVSDPVNGRSPAEIGISFDKKGSIEFDKEKFAAALTDDPAFVEAVFAEIATRVAAAADGASNATTGTLSSKISGSETTVKGFTTQIEAWDRRLDTREATLKKIYATLEVNMGKLNSQQDYITSQLAALNASKD